MYQLTYEKPGFEKENPNPILTGPLARQAWSMSWPLIATYSLTAVIGLVDCYLSGLLGGKAQAAVGIGDQAILFAVMAGTGLSTAAVACVAREIGAGRMATARSYARDSIVLSFIIGLLATVFGISSADMLVNIAGTNVDSAPLCKRYLEVSSWANLPFIFSMTASAIFRAAGLPKLALSVWLNIALVSIIGSLALFFGPWHQIRYSVDALSVAWVAGAATGMAVSIFHLKNWLGVLNRESSLSGTSLFASGQSFLRAKELVFIAIPAVIADVVWTISNTINYKFLAMMPHAVETQAAWSLAVKLEETMASMPVFAVSLATAAIVGQNMGAQLPQRARSAGLQVAFFCTAFLLLVGCLLALFSYELAALLSPEPLIVEKTATILRAAPFVIPPIGLWLILIGAVEGTGSTVIPMSINVTGLLAVRLPIAFLMIVTMAQPIPGLLISVGVSRLLMAWATILTFNRTIKGTK